MAFRLLLFIRCLNCLSMNWKISASMAPCAKMSQRESWCSQSCALRTDAAGLAKSTDSLAIEIEKHRQYAAGYSNSRSDACRFSVEPIDSTPCSSADDVDDVPVTWPVSALNDAVFLLAVVCRLRGVCAAACVLPVT